TERHSFTIGNPYKVDIDVGFGGNGNATFTADHTGVFTYYGKYHLPVMTGQLVLFSVNQRNADLAPLIGTRRTKTMLIW
ncbi:MAG TPA: hypothetical protein VF220_09535, partial [Nitrososphaeraceae archaeon]